MWDTRGPIQLLQNSVVELTCRKGTDLGSSSLEKGLKKERERIEAFAMEQKFVRIEAEGFPCEFDPVLPLDCFQQLAAVISSDPKIALELSFGINALVIAQSVMITYQ